MAGSSKTSRRPLAAGPVEEEVVLSAAGLSLRPVLNRKAFEAHEILVVGGHHDQPIDVGDRRNLAIDKWRWVSQGFVASAFLAVPCRGGLVVRQDRKGAVDDITQIGLQCCSSFPLGKPPASENEFVPNWRCDRALCAVRLETLQNRRIPRLRDGRRDDASIEEKREFQKDTLRPVVRSRTEAAKPSTMPISAIECVLRNFRYASRKCRRFPRRRSNSRCETSTATG